MKKILTLACVLMSVICFSQTRRDTVPVIMLVSDTLSETKFDSVYRNYSYIIIPADNKIKYIKGYEVRFTGDLNPNYIYWEWLDINKKHLSRTTVVWITKELKN